MPKKEYDFSAFDEIESTQEEASKEADKGEYDFSSFDTDMADLSDQEQEEMGAIEAAITGLGQGASFGLTPILGGISGVVTEVGEDIGDVLGLTEDARLRKEGFKVEDEYEGLKGLVDAYYAQRERQKRQEEKAYEEQPVAAFGGSLLGGITSMGGAAKLASKVPSLAGILPKAESVKGLSAAQKAGVAVREGAKAGGLAGFGAGEAKLAEGEIGKAAKETAGTAIAGGLFGGALSGAGSTIGSGAKVIKDFPIFKNIKLGYTAGQKGIDISNEKQVSDFVRDTAETVRKEISKRFKGASKKQLLNQADELGIRVSAGETIEDIIEDIKQTGAFGKEAQKDLNKFVQDLKSLQKGIDPDLQKASARVELASAKKINKIIREGGDIETRTEFQTPLEEITPLPETKGKVLGVEDLVKLKSGDRKKILTQAALEESQVPLKQYDLENMKVSELDELISKVGTRAFDSKEDAAVPYAKKLYAGLRELSNSALEDSSIPEKNKKLKALFDGLDSLGIKPNEFFSQREVIKDEIQNKIQQKLTASPLSSSDNKMQNFLKYLRRADEELADSIEGQSEFATDIARFVRQSEGEGSVSLKAAVGPVQKVFAKVGNIVGMGAKSLKESRKQSIDYLKSLTPEDVRIMSSELTKRFGEKATPYTNQLNVALNSPGQRKTALLYSINQQPAFRKMLETTGKQILGESEAQASEEMQGIKNEEDITNNTMPDTTSGIEFKKKVENTREPSSVVEEVSSTAPGVDLDFLGRREGYSTEGYIPVEGKGKNYTSNSGSGTIAGKSGVTIANGLDLGQRNNLDDIDVSDNIKEKLTPYLGKKKQDALDELRKNPLVLTEDESKELSEAVERSYYNQVKNKFNKNKNGRDFETLPNAVKTALYSLYYNQGSIGPKTLEAASNDDNYDDLIKEFRNYYEKGSKSDKGFAGDRRRIEADYMEKMLKDYKKYKDYNKA